MQDADEIGRVPMLYIVTIIERWIERKQDLQHFGKGSLCAFSIDY